MTHALDAWKARRQAARNRQPPQKNQTSLRHSVERLGICRITSTGPDAGEYTATLQHWFDGAWYDATDCGGFVDLPVRDFRDRDFGKIDQRVLFWTQGDLDGRTRVWIDVTSKPHIAVEDDDATRVEEVSDLVLAGDNGIVTSAIDDGDGAATVYLSLPTGGGGGDLLYWHAADGRWKVLEAIGGISDKIPWLQANDSLQWVDPCFSRLGVGSTEIDGVSLLYLHPNDLQNSNAGPIRMSQTHSGSTPQHTVDVIIEHYAPHGDVQEVSVRKGDDSGAVTLRFDKFGHFLAEV